MASLLAAPSPCSVSWHIVRDWGHWRYTKLQNTCDMMTGHSLGASSSLLEIIDSFLSISIVQSFNCIISSTLRPPITVPLWLKVDIFLCDFLLYLFLCIVSRAVSSKKPNARIVVNSPIISNTTLNVLRSFGK